jgi:predicted small metal-binding protein
MSRELHCSDAGMQCDYIAKGETDDEVMNQASQHVMQNHAAAVSSLSEEDRNKFMMTARSAIHDSSMHDQQTMR